jgi:predicted phage terminase large subunit-like protein
VRRSTPAQLETYAAGLEGHNLAMFEQAVGEITASGWRSDPARMANYLTQGNYELWPYIVLLSENFAAAIKGQRPRQQWQLPSQYGKTTALKRGITWALDLNPKLRFLYLSYDAKKAVEEMGDVRDWAEQHNDFLRFRIRPDKRARGMWSTEEGGGLYATGIRGGIVGYPADVILLDDLIKGWQAAHSATERDFVWNVYRSAIRLRLQALQCPIIDVGTRWHEDDHHRRLIDQAVPGETWHVIRLPATAEAPDPNATDPLLREPDALGRAPGDVLEAKRFPPEEVEARRVTLGTYLWAAMEQQRPAPEEGTEVLRAWFQVEVTLPPKPDRAIASWDLKSKDKESGDYVVGQLWWRVGGGYWLMDQLRGQWNNATVKNAMALMKVRHPEISLQLFENAGNAPELTAELRRGDRHYEVQDDVANKLGMTENERNAVQMLIRHGMSSLIPVTPKGDKSMRMRAVSPTVEGRNVHLPAGAAWVPLYLDEMSAFPNGAHDDQVDATSQALARLGRGVTTARGSGAAQRNTRASTVR